METPPSSSDLQSPPSPRLPPPPALRVRFAAIGEGWSLIRQDMIPWVVAMLLLMGVSYGVELLAMPALLAMAPAADAGSPRGSAYTAGYAVGFFAVYSAMFIAIAVLQGVISTLPQRFSLRKLRGQSASVNDMFSLDGAFGRVAAWWLLYPFLFAVIPAVLFGLAVLVGGGISSAPSGLLIAALAVAYVLTLVSFLVIQSLFALVPLLIVDQQLGVFEAARVSARTLARHLPAMTGVYFCAAFISALGACACGLGFLVTGSILYATIGVMYNDFFRPAQPLGQEVDSWYPRPA